MKGVCKNHHLLVDTHLSNLQLIHDTLLELSQHCSNNESSTCLHSKLTTVNFTKYITSLTSSSTDHHLLQLLKQLEIDILSLHYELLLALTYIEKKNGRGLQKSNDISMMVPKVMINIKDVKIIFTTFKSINDDLQQLLMNSTKTTSFQSSSFDSSQELVFLVDFDKYDDCYEGISIDLYRFKELLLDWKGLNYYTDDDDDKMCQDAVFMENFELDQDIQFDDFTVTISHQQAFKVY